MTEQTTEFVKKIRFIINPISGIKQKKRIERLISRYLKDKPIKYEIIYTKEKGHAIALAQEAVSLNYNAVIAVGGDGSINEIARGLLNSSTALGIIKAGSGNGLARTLKIPSSYDKALRVILDFNTTRIDTATINDRFFINLAGTGFDAHVAEKFASLNLRGGGSYLRLVFGRYLFYRPRRYKIYVDGRVIRRKALMISFANSKQFGMNALIAPTASLTDGMIDVCIFHKAPSYLAFFLFPLLFIGKLQKTPFLEIVKTSQATLIQRENKISHIDGDIEYLSKKLEVKINPLSINIIVPKHK